MSLESFLKQKEPGDLDQPDDSTWALVADFDGKPVLNAVGKRCIYSKSKDKDLLQLRANVNNGQLFNKLFYHVIKIDS